MRQLHKAKKLSIALIGMDARTVWYVAHAETYEKHEAKCAIACIYLMAGLCAFTLGLLFSMEYIKHNN